MREKRKFDLEDRLLNFSLLVSDFSESLPKSDTGRYLSGQLVRSGLAPCLIYGEAMSAESNKDFVHKMKIGLKELRETFMSLKLIKLKKYEAIGERLEFLLDECNQLICIFVKSIQTAEAGRK